MHCLKSLIVVTMFVASPSWSHAEQLPSANQLVVEASQLILSADSASTPEQAISLLEAAHRKLVLITEAHPSSHLAVRLATGQGIGTVSLAGVQAAIKAATEQCWTSLSLLCVARLTVETAIAADRDVRYLWDKALRDAATAQAAAGQFAAAIKTVELIQLTGWRAKALLNITAAQRKARKAEEAQLLMDKVLAFATSIDDTGDRARVLAQVVEAQAAAGQFSAAIETAASIDDAESRANALLDVAKIQTKAGNVADGRMTAQRAGAAAWAIQNPSDQAAALSHIASASIDMGDRENAKATIDRAVAAVPSAPQSERDWRWFSALTAIAKAQTKAGQSEAAQRTLTVAFEGAQAVADVEKRLERLFKIAAAQTEVGDAESARLTRDTAIKHFKAAPKDSMLVSVFPTYIVDQPLEADQATEVIALFKSPEVKNTLRDTGLPDEYALAALVRSLARTRTVSTVTEVRQLIGDTELMDSVLRDLVDGQIGAAQFTEAIETARLIKDPSERVLPLNHIAETQARADQVADARETIGLMTEAVKASGEDSLSLIFLAQAQMKAGLVRDAKGSLRKALQGIKQEVAGGYRFNYGKFSYVLELLLEMHETSLL